MDLEKFKRLPLLGILRGITPDVIEPLVETVISSGLETIEVAMNTPKALELIRRIKDCAGGKLVLGAGTVLTKEELHEAIEAGATFIVLPVVVPEVVEECFRDNIPVFPGAFTAQEIYDAWRAGATMVKVFPAKFLGPAYIKEIKGPLSDIELLACGGITPDTIQPFFSSGASAVAFGASVFKKEWIAEKEFGRIKESIKALIKEFRAYQKAEV
jgi:2-dehydro-3-deoxyphosphogluconate aldolase/(4S)-4-hydroxy-2-oxoglutarate aldolase